MREIVSGNPTVFLHKANQYSDSARYDSAIFFYRKAAFLYHKQHNKKLHIHCLNKIGLHFFWLGQLAKSSQILHHSLSYSIRTFGEQAAPTAQGYAYLSQVLVQLEQFKEADSLVQRSYQIRSRLLGENHPSTAESLGLLGVIQLNDSKNNYEKALRTGLKALQVQLQLHGSHHPATALSYLSVGIIHNTRAEYQQALEMLHRSDTILQQTLHKHHFVRGRLNLAKGIAYMRLGRMQEARHHLEQAATIFRTSTGRNSPFTATAYGQLGSLSCDEGNYEQAILYFRQELAGSMKLLGDKHTKTGSIYAKIGFAYGQMGDPEKYLQNCQTAFHITTQQSDTNRINIAHASFMLASAFIRNQRYEEAIEHFERAKDIFSRDLGENHPMVANCLQGLGRVYKQLHYYDTAFQNYRRALGIFEQKFGPYYCESAFTYKMIGDIWQEQQQLDSALAAYQQAIAVLVPEYAIEQPYQNPLLSQVNNRRVLYYNLLDAKAAVFRQRFERTSHQVYDLAFALKNVEQAAALIDTIRIGYKGEEARMLLSEHTQFVYQHGLEIAYQLYQHTSRPMYLEKAFYFSEKRKASVLLNVARKISAERTAGIPTALLTREEALKKTITSYDQKIREAEQQKDAVSAVQLQEWVVASAKAKESYLQFVDTLEHSYPEYYRLKYDTRTATLQQIQQCLAPKQALISYSLTDSATFIFVITSQKLFLQQVKNTFLLDEQIRCFRQTLLNKEVKQYAQPAYQLYQSLIEPIRDQLTDVQHLTIIPEGTISYVPFETLLTKPSRAHSNYAKFPYLLKEFSILYNFSGTFFVQHAHRKQDLLPKGLMAFAPNFGEKGLVAVGIPISDRPRQRLQPLPGADREAERIAHITGGKCLAGLQATEARFKATAYGHDVLHLATHALLDDQYPAYSKLVFAPAKGETEDGYLHAYELYNLRLDAKLVVLSACNTGIGSIKKGEGVMSLARGFSYAGCSTVLMSLWPSPDQATAQIMEYFYEGLAEGLGKDAALHQAKLKYLEKADPLTANPYFWGTFVLIGDSHQIMFPFMLWHKVLTVLALLLAGGLVAWRIVHVKNKRAQFDNALSRVRAFSP